MFGLSIAKLEEINYKDIGNGYEWPVGQGIWDHEWQIWDLSSFSGNVATHFIPVCYFPHVQQAQTSPGRKAQGQEDRLQFHTFFSSIS